MRMRRAVLTWETVVAQVERARMESVPGFEWFQVDRETLYTASVLFDGDVVTDDEAVKRLRALAEVESYTHYAKANEPKVKVRDVDPEWLPTQEMEHDLIRAVRSGGWRHDKPVRGRQGDVTAAAVPEGGSADSEPAQSPTAPREVRIVRCGAENPDYPGEYACEADDGHDRIPDEEGVLYDHAAPRIGAWWNTPVSPPLRPWRLGESWATKGGRMVTVVAVGHEPADDGHRRPDDVLLFATDQKTAADLVRERNDLIALLSRKDRR